YCELIFMLGSDFDTDPQYPWAATILTDPAVTDQMVRADHLFQAVMRLLEATAGPERVHAKESLRRARQEAFAGVAPGTPQWEKESLDRLRRIYPQKCDYVGEAALRNLLKRGLVFAQEQGVTSGAGVALIVALMFSIGHGFNTDPHVPWIGGTLTRRGT